MARVLIFALSLSPLPLAQGDNDPLDVCEIGLRILGIGEVVPVKVCEGEARLRRVGRRPGRGHGVGGRERPWVARFCLDPPGCDPASPTQAHHTIPSPRRPGAGLPYDTLLTLLLTLT